MNHPYTLDLHRIRQRDLIAEADRANLARAVRRARKRRPGLALRA